MAFFPPSGPPQSPQVTTLWVSPAGNNVTGDGSYFTPLKTICAAYDKLYSRRLAGQIDGGNIIFADLSAWSDGTEGGGVVAGQGIWLIDPLGSGVAYTPLGFRRYMPINIIGDTTYTTGGFNETGRARLAVRAVASDRFRSTGVWLIGGCEDFNLTNAVTGDGNNPLGTAFRAGWDFARDPADPNFGPLLTNITAASRASGVTTWTLALPAAISIVSASRSNNITTLVINYASAGLTCGIPWSHGAVPFTLTSTSGSFSSGTKTQTQLVGDATTCAISYSDPGPNVGTTSMAGSTVQSHGMAVGDSFDTVSTNAEWPSTMYGPITACVGTTQVLTADPYGSTGDPNAAHHATASASNIGKYVQQLRNNLKTALFKLSNIEGVTYPPNLPDQYWTGPAFDFGLCAAGDWAYCEESTWQGLVLDQPGQKTMDFRREAAMLVDAGADGATGFTFSSLKTQNGGLVYYRAPGALASIDQMMQDSDVASSPPTVKIISRNGGGGTTILRNIQTADALTSDSLPTVDIDPTADPQSTGTTGCGVVRGPHVGIADYAAWSALTNTLPAMGAVGFWGNDRVAGFHPAALIGGGPTASRFRNIIGVSGLSGSGGTWAKADPATTVVGGIDDRYGGTSAWRITAGAAIGGVYLLPATSIDQNTGGTINHQIGDLWGLGMDIRRVSGSPALTILYEIGPSPVGYQLVLTPDYANDGGWQWVKTSGVVNNVPSPSASYRIAFLLVGDAAGVVDISFPRGVRVSVDAGIKPDEWGQFAQAIRPQDRYHLPGIVGTLAGQKLVGHGGIGTAARYTVGGGAGQITIGASATQAIEVFDEAGNSLGVIRPNTFTVN